ncbi:MAG: hypothetical protein ACREOW_03290 [Thermodesulfobacteriota bacterium]
MHCDETTAEGTRVNETATSKKGKLVKGPAGVIWVKPTNSCWVQFDGEPQPKLVPCPNLEPE